MVLLYSTFSILLAFALLFPEDFRNLIYLCELQARRLGVELRRLWLIFFLWPRLQLDRLKLKFMLWKARNNTKSRNQP